MSKAKAKKMPSDFRPHEYPYMIVWDRPKPVTYHKTAGEAKKKILAAVERYGGQMSMFGSDVHERIERINKTVSELPSDGGSLDELLDEYTGVRFRAELVKRPQ